MVYNRLVMKYIFMIAVQYIGDMLMINERYINFMDCIDSLTFFVCLYKHSAWVKGIIPKSCAYSMPDNSVPTVHADYQGTMPCPHRGFN